MQEETLHNPIRVSQIKIFFISLLGKARGEGCVKRSLELEKGDFFRGPPTHTWRKAGRSVDCCDQVERSSIGLKLGSVDTKLESGASSERRRVVAGR